MASCFFSSLVDMVLAIQDTWSNVFRVESYLVPAPPRSGEMIEVQTYFHTSYINLARLWLIFSGKIV